MSELIEAPPAGGLAGAAEALAAGDLTSTALVEQLLARHNEVDGTIRGFLTLEAERVLAAAAAADKRRSDGELRSPYDGLPIALKDNISAAGETCGCASKLLAGYTATFDSTVAERLKAAGMICFGRGNMDEFAMGSSTENSGYGATRNPHNPDCVPGGSSGGPAAIVASGQAPAALGTDTGGSIRQPASFCGVVGLKPTYGLVSRYGIVAYGSSLDQVGPLTTSVRDAAIVLDVIGGHDPRDSTSITGAKLGLTRAIDSAGGEISDLRVGLPREYFEVDGLAPAVRSTVETAVAKLADAGCPIVELSLPSTAYAVAVYYVIATAEASSNLARFDGIRYGARVPSSDLLETYFQTREQGFGKEVKRRIILGTFVLSEGYADAYYLQALKVRTLIRQEFAAAFQQCDVIISPTAPTAAFRCGAISDPLQMYLGDIYTVPVNLAGNCGISVPFAVDPDGLPIGIQLIGDVLGEAGILRTAHWLERHKAD